MWIVAVTTYHLLPFKWVRRALIYVSFLLSVAIGAYSNFSCSICDRVVSSVDLMTVGTADICIVVMVAAPSHALIIVMATHTNAVLFFRWNRGV